MLLSRGSRSSAMVAIGHADGGDGSGTRQVHEHDTCCIDATLALAELFVRCCLQRCSLTSIQPCQRMVKSMRSCLSRPDAMRMMSGNVSECVGAIDNAFGHRFGHGFYIGARGRAHDGDWYGAPRARVTSPQVAQVDGMLVLREYYNSTTQPFHARDDPAEIHTCEGGYTANALQFGPPRPAPTQ